MTDSLDVSYIERIIVFGYALVGNIEDFQKSFKKYLIKHNRLGLRLRLNCIIETELFIWIWIMTEFYGSLYLKNEGMDNEEYLFRKIHKIYFAELTKGEKDLYDVYDFWDNYISQTLNTSHEDYEGQDYDHRVKEKMIRGFSLKIFKYIKPKIFRDEYCRYNINETYGNKITSIQNETEIFLYFSLDLLMNCFKEFDKIQINENFEKIRTTKLVKKIIEELVKP